MMDNLQRTYWGSSSNLHPKYEGCNIIDDGNQIKEERTMFPCCDSNLNFSTATCSEDDSEFGSYKRGKLSRQDPMSHRIIEKRRRDRMNNCLADLSRLIPTDYLKKGRGRIEKTEIIEMAIKHMKFLQQDSDSGEQYRLGYQECMSEAMRFMVEVEGYFSHEAICVRLLSHLQKHCADLPHRTSHVPQTVPNTERFSVPPIIERNTISVPEYESAKTDLERNNDECKNVSYDSNVYPRNLRNHEETESSQMSYKYKTNIKMRFNQDLNGEVDAKRPKINTVRRNSVNSNENRSLTHSSPTSSEVCTRISDGENNNRTSPSESTLSSNNHLKIDLSNESTNPSSPREGSLQSLKVKNFKIPIFMLHSKGSYYIPLTVDYKILSPYMHNYDMADDVPNTDSVPLHPVTINVNFQPNFYTLDNSKFKCDYTRNNWN